MSRYNEQEDSWRISDPDCCQCIRTADQDKRIYEMYQIDDYSGIDQGYRIAHGVIDLNQYSDQEILFYLKLFSYNTLEEVKGDNGIMDWSLVAEMIFETNAMNYEDCEQFKTYEAAEKKILEYTGLKLKSQPDSEIYKELEDAKNHQNFRLILAARDPNHLLYGVEEANEALNQSNIKVIEAMQKTYGNVYLGKINTSHISGKTGLRKYEGEKLYNSCYDFCVPVYDEDLDKLLHLWNSESKIETLELIYEKIKQADGVLLIWS